ncbi:MAG: translation initiation factor IF-2 N-terminal domain-containing protein, partial [Clostridia bacterium]|nr:translation initiation factor IF-2 N-terminal domain-containing protein [Clostridia bacterium]
MAKVKVCDLAKELGVESKDIIAIAAGKGYEDVKSASKGLEDDQVAAIKAAVNAKKAPKTEAPKTEAPKAEAPKAEAPKAEASQPAAKPAQ